MSEEKDTNVEVAEETKAAPEETKEEAPAEEAGEDVEVPKKFKDLVDAVESMSVLDLHELVKLLEKKFGVSAAAVAVAGAGAGAGEAAEEKTEYDVELKSFGEAKIPVMKAVKEALGLGLKEAKELVEAAPTILKTAMKKEDAEAMQTAIKEAGGTVELK